MGDAIGGYMPRKDRRFTAPVPDDGILRCERCRARLDFITPWNQPHICKEITYGTPLPPLRPEEFQDERKRPMTETAALPLEDEQR